MQNSNRSRRQLGFGSEPDLKLDVRGVRYSRCMDKIWSADELMAMSPAERQALFEANNSTDLESVPDRLLELARQDVQAHIRRTESTPAIDV